MDITKTPPDIGYSWMVHLPLYGQFLRPEDVQDGDLVKILDEGEIRKKEDTRFERDVFNINIALSNGETRSWTMNKTTQKAIAAKHGKETKEWIGKKVRIKKIRENVRGTMRDVIYGDPAD